MFRWSNSRIRPVGGTNAYPEHFGCQDLKKRVLRMRKVFVLFAAAAALSVAACNTIAGVGRDAQAAGSAVEQAAEDAAD